MIFYEPTNSFICFKCKHFNELQGGCLAFPGGIPFEISSGLHGHKKPLKDQENKIVFERQPVTEIRLR